MTTGGVVVNPYIFSCCCVAGCYLKDYLRRKPLRGGVLIYFTAWLGGGDRDLEVDRFDFRATALPRLAFYELAELERCGGVLDRCFLAVDCSPAVVVYI